ncbi:MAG: hypothetical protein QM756_11645 [Polyangiaceae bacterium]
MRAPSFGFYLTVSLAVAALSVACGNSGDSPGGEGGAVGQGGSSNGAGGSSTVNGGSPNQGQGGNPSGGASNGGSANGGNGNGGAQAGGSTSGGNGNGGAQAGGSTSGGSSTASGGSSNGGAQAGGASTGGRANSGGSSSGGQAAGGTSSGGATTTSGGRASGGAASGGASSGGAASGGATTTSGGASSTTPIKVWMAGDSTMMNCSSACPCGWGSQFDPLFNTNVTVVNSAVGGRSIQTWLYESAPLDSSGNPTGPGVTGTLNTSTGECNLYQAAYVARWNAMLNASTGMKAGDYLIIQFGINDGDSACPRHVGQALYKTYLGVMAKAAKDRGAQPIFVTPVSAISCNSSGKAVGTRGAFVTTTITAGTELGVPVIDLHQLSVDLYNSLGFCPNNADYSSGIVGAFFCADHTHFEAAGATQIAKVVAKALRDQKIPLASYLLP